jgi:hypothetical protein
VGGKIRALSAVDDYLSAIKWQVQFISPVFFKSYGMQASWLLPDPDKPFRDIQAGTMVNDRGNSAEQIFVQPPGRPEPAGNLHHFLDQVTVTVMDIPAPFPVIGIDSVGQRRK